MRLVKLDIKKNDLGIEPISFLKKDFNHIIALVGKNGSGKSRVLELIKNFISDCSPQVFSKYVSHLTPQMQQLLPDLLSYRATNAVAEQQYKNNLARFRVEVASHVKFIDGKILSNVTTGKAIDINALLNNTYQTNADNNEINGFNIDTVFNHVKEVALDITNDKVFQYLDETSLPSDSENKLKILNEYLFHFLGKQFEYIAIKGVSKGTFDVKLNFSGREFKIQELSPGQRVLYRFAILFYIYDVNSTTKLKDSIIIIDEPEIHLHPSAQIELINKLINIVKDKGQLWLATHSINILSHLDYESILLVSNNTVYPPSRKNPSKVFDELIDMSSHVDEFTNFVSARNDWHYANYIKECFLNPEVVNTLNIEDPQYLLLNEKLRVGRIEMLDFGAGVGRIGQIIHEDNLSDKVRYNAYEIDPERANQIRTTGVAKNVFTNITEITANNYDFIVVCNVFHEINPKEWLTNINAIKTALKDDGFLLILEDLELVRGENAHEFGYIILGIEELEILFENEKLITTRPSNDDRLSDRLYLCAVNKIDISVTETSITNAIKALNNKTIKKIQLIRESLNEDDARKYAFYSQLFINSTLYLNYVSKKKYEDLLK